MLGPQKHHFKVMAGKSKGMYCPKIFLEYLCIQPEELKIVTWMGCETWRVEMKCANAALFL
jgi:hypothetical protein